MNKVKVTLIKSKSGATERQIRTLTAIGIGKRTSSVVIEKSPVFAGMIQKVQHLVTIEEVK